MENSSESNSSESIIKDLAKTVTNRIGQPFVLSYIIVWFYINDKFILKTLPSATSLVDLGNKIYLYISENTSWWFVGYIFFALVALSIYQLSITASFWLIEWVQVKVRPWVSRKIFPEGWKPMVDFLEEKDHRIEAEGKLEQLELRVRTAVADMEDAHQQLESSKSANLTKTNELSDLKTKIENVAHNKGQVGKFIDSELERIHLSNSPPDKEDSYRHKLYSVLSDNIKRLLIDNDLDRDGQQYQQTIDKHRMTEDDFQAEEEF